MPLFYCAPSGRTLAFRNTDHSSAQTLDPALFRAASDQIPVRDISSLNGQSLERDPMWMHASLIFIWTVGIIDASLTTWLVANDGASAELNPLAQFAINQLGVISLFPFKLIMLGVMTHAIRRALREHSMIAKPALSCMVMVSAGLAIWWMLAVAPLS